MKQSDVPQDNNSSYAGIRKGLYATDGDGQYKLIPSNGWEPEHTVLSQALSQLEQEADAAKARVVAGKSSVLEFYMYHCRMDLGLLAQSTGQFKWRVKRHLKPQVFARLSEKQLTIYAEALGIELHDLKTGKLPT